jgi:kynurenine formamidase
VSAVLHLAGRRFDMSRGRSLAREIRFTGDAGLAFGIPAARERAFVAGDFIGDVGQGGSVNCRVLELCAHGVGTHTETIGHLVEGAPPPHESAPTGPVLAQLVRVVPVKRGDDRVITAALLDALEDDVTAVVIDAGTSGPYSGTNPPYLDEGAAALLRARGVDHLLTDLPSVDREDDAELPAHRAFFDDGGGRTITELCDIGDAPEGLYALSLQLPPLVTDASPSRPILYDLIQDSK